MQKTVRFLAFSYQSKLGDKYFQGGSRSTTFYDQNLSSDTRDLYFVSIQKLVKSCGLCKMILVVVAQLGAEAFSVDDRVIANWCWTGPSRIGCTNGNKLWSEDCRGGLFNTLLEKVKSLR